MDNIEIASPPTCPSCESGRISLWGPLPTTKLFAGKVADTATLASSLYSCENCHVVFRWPRLSRAETVRMYSSGDDGSLQYQQQNRQDWMIARQWLRNRPPPGNLILDVGCFDGEFLHTLGGEWERHGVELDQAAAHRAASKGIRMIADDIDHLKQTPHGKRFGCVVAMDVIEHMENPRSFLMDLLEMTLPGGMVIISSGDTESWTWRFMGSRYWYCLFSDHISFINEQWCRWFAREHRVELQYLQRFSHGDSTDRKLFWMDMLKNIAYRISPSLFALLRKQGMGEIDVNRHPELIDSPPLWRTACDHLIVCFINKERRA